LLHVTPVYIIIFFSIPLLNGWLGHFAVYGRILTGTQGPVILGEDKIYEDDPISFSTLGISLTPFIDFTYDLSSFLAVGFDIGFQWAISLKSGLYAKHGEENIEVSTTSGNFYLPNSTYPPTEMTMSPIVSLTGFKANAHVTYRW